MNAVFKMSENPNPLLFYSYLLFLRVEIFYDDTNKKIEGEE